MVERIYNKLITDYYNNPIILLKKQKYLTYQVADNAMNIPNEQIKNIAKNMGLCIKINDEKNITIKINNNINMYYNALIFINLILILDHYIYNNNVINTYKNNNLYNKSTINTIQTKCLNGCNSYTCINLSDVINDNILVEHIKQNQEMTDDCSTYNHMLCFTPIEKYSYMEQLINHITKSLNVSFTNDKQIINKVNNNLTDSILINGKAQLILSYCIKIASKFFYK